MRRVKGRLETVSLEPELLVHLLSNLDVELGKLVVFLANDLILGLLEFLLEKIMIEATACR